MDFSYRGYQIVRFRNVDLYFDTPFFVYITVTAAKLIAEAVEFLRAGYYGAHCTYGIPQHE